MRKAVAATAAAAAVVVGGVVGVAAWSGRAVTARLEQQTLDLSKAFPALKVVEQKVEHGLFSSSRVVTLQLGCLPTQLPGVPGAPGAPGAPLKPGAPEPLRLSFRDVVHHGPFPGGSGVGLARIDSELVSPAAWKERIAKLTDNHPLLQIHTRVAFDGSTVSELEVPPLHYADPASGSFESKGLSGRVEASGAASASHGGSYLVALPASELSMRATDGTSLTMKVGAVSSSTELSPRPDPTLWLGGSKVSGRMSSLELLGTAAQGLPVRPVQAVFGELRFDSESKLEGGLFSSASHMTGKGLVNQVAIDNIELRASLKRIHAATYQKLLARMFDGLLSCDPAAQQAALGSALDDLQQSVSALLLHDPEYSLDTLAVEIAGKRAELSYSLGTHGVTAADAGQPLPALLLQKGVLRASVKVHTGLIAQAIKQLGALDPSAAAAAGLPPGPAGADQTLSLVNGMTDQFVQLGYLEREGESIKASASFEQGKVLVNGKPIALPDLGALGGM
ncbi:MAG: hypothetical protein JWN48_4744 [Myxococcaceae bacterium]|nr:hypothetical protein [Myxococcaceae bacterium]